LENRTPRLRLPQRKKPFSVLIAPSIHLAYRRNAGPGTWSVKCNGWLKRFALADDHEDANGETVLNFWQAQDRARALARAGEANSETPISVIEAVDVYEKNLKTRGGNKANADQIRLHLADTTLERKVAALLTEKDLRDWRDNLVTHKGLKPATANRLTRSLKAALYLVASGDTQISKVLRCLEPLPEDDTSARNLMMILPDPVVRMVVRGVYEQDPEIAALIDTLAETGTRESQALKLTPHDLKDETEAPHLTMPSSLKGRNRRKRGINYGPLPISPRLAKVLRQLASSRAASGPLFDKPRKLSNRFRSVARRLGLSSELTPYCLRHTSIVRQLLKGVPVRVVAAHHDTSIAMIEKHYSRYILKSTDAQRASLPDFDTSAEIIPMRQTL
jgi:integrase